MKDDASLYITGALCSHDFAYEIDTDEEEIWFNLGPIRICFSYDAARHLCHLFRKAIDEAGSSPSY